MGSREFLTYRCGLRFIRILCDKIHEIYPEIGSCDKELKVVWDNEKMCGKSTLKRMDTG
jgi:hypothetical protein